MHRAQVIYPNVAKNISTALVAPILITVIYTAIKLSDRLQSSPRAGPSRRKEKCLSPPQKESKNLNSVCNTSVCDKLPQSIAGHIPEISTSIRLPVCLPVTVQHLALHVDTNRMFRSTHDRRKWNSACGWQISRTRFWHCLLVNRVPGSNTKCKVERDANLLEPWLPSPTASTVPEDPWTNLRSKKNINKTESRKKHLDGWEK